MLRRLLLLASCILAACPLSCTAATLWTHSAAPWKEEVVVKHGEALIPSHLSANEAEEPVLLLAALRAQTWSGKQLHLLHRVLSKDNLGLATLYGALCLFICLVVLGMYWPRGIGVVARVLVYLFALATMKLCVKFIFEEYDYNYPKFVTGLHFAFCIVVSVGVLLYDSKEVKTDSASQSSASPAEILRRGVPTQSEFWFQIFPIAFTFAYSVGADNLALIYVSAAFSEIVSATSPIASAVLVAMLGLPFHLRLVPPVLLVVLCCAISTSGEVNFSFVGFVLCIFAVLGRAVKGSLQQKVMQGPSRHKFDPVTLLLWTCLPALALIIVWSVMSEGSAPYADMAKMDGGNRLGMSCIILISCVNACILNLSNLFVTRDLGAVGIQLVGQVKAILTFLGSMVLFGDPVTTREVLGFGGVLLGVLWFTHTDNMLRKAEDKSEEGPEKAVEEAIKHSPPSV